MGWIRKPKSRWPFKRSFGQVPAEEMWKDMVAMAWHTAAVEDKQSRNQPFGKLRRG
jgi:hypothetical protein